MVRLIDADVLLMKQASIARNCAKSEGQKALMGRVMYNTEKAPTVDAIPVEWLREKIASDYEPDSKAALRVLRMWEKEQEAR